MIRDNFTKLSAFLKNYAYRCAHAFYQYKTNKQEMLHK